MSKFRIAATTENDVPHVLRMIRDFAAFENLSEYCEVTEEKLYAAMFSANSCVESLIAFNHKNEAIGYALFYENFASFRGQRGVYLEDLYVAPEARNAGVGLMLIKHLAQITTARGAERIDFLVLDWNETAIKFYQKLGAEIDEAERHFKFVGASFESLANVNGRSGD